MKTLFKSWIVQALALLFAATTVFAQERVPFRQQELDQMLAPIALYPDSLLSQVLMASTYPLEVVQAARWSRANPGLRGQDAVRAVEGRDWDPSVKSLTAFPQVLLKLDENIEWMERLGEAFLAQQADVMDSVQGLRRRAEVAGNLHSSDQMRVARDGEVITIHQPAPEIVYVPHYSPVVVYGPWWWPAYPPVYWAPPSYYVASAYQPAFIWGPGIAISAGFFFGHADWHHRHVTVVNNQTTNVIVNRTSIHRTNVVDNRRTEWRHDPAHRRGVPFRHPEARQKYEQARVSHSERRDSDRNDARARPVHQPEARNPRTERPAPQAGDRRSERGNGRYPQARNTESRRDASAPVVRRDTRPAFPAVTTHAAPQRMREGSRRVEPRNDGNRVRQHSATRENAPAARPSTSVPQRAPARVENHSPRGNGARPQDRGNQRNQSANRDGNRRS